MNIHLKLEFFQGFQKKSFMSYCLYLNYCTVVENTDIILANFEWTGPLYFVDKEQGFCGYYYWAACAQFMKFK